MIEIAGRYQGVQPVTVDDQLTLPFDLRQRSRLHTTLVSGAKVRLVMPRGEMLRGGDLLQTAAGGVIEVLAAAEKVLHIECATGQALARAAYHLGNRHVPVEVGDGYLRVAEDHVLEAMLRGLGATVTHFEAPFEPEAGAYHHGRVQSAETENASGFRHAHG